MNLIRFYRFFLIFLSISILCPKAIDPVEKDLKEILNIGEKRREYFQLHKNDLTYEIEGPLTLEIYSRRAVPLKEIKDWRFGYQILLDDQPSVATEYFKKNSSGVTSSQHPGHGYTKSGRHIVKIPSGSHVIRLTPEKDSSPPLLIRIIVKKKSRSGEESELLDPQGENVTRYIQINEKTFKYIELTPGSDIIYSINKKGELNLISRLSFDDRMTGEEPYRLRIWEDDQVIGTYYFSTERSAESTVRDDKKSVPGKWRSCLVNTKSGSVNYRIELLDKDRKVYVRGIFYQ
ncbi:MAG: hypothetical protein ACE5D7_03770 [Fidelibacterota bacterium]